MSLPLRSLAFLPAVILCLSAAVPAGTAQVSSRPLSSTSLSTPADAAAPASPEEVVLIPGPLRSFLRMAGISQEVTPDEVLPLLARNVGLHGYDNGAQTEFLVLLNRYVQFARQLQLLADAQGIIHVSGCQDADRLVQALGYHFQQACGQKDAWLITGNAERAFLTIDSGFPLTTLESALQKHIPFTYPFPTTRVPVLFREKEWMAASAWKNKPGANLIDVLLHDQNLDRLYWAFSKQDQETQSALRHSPGVRRLLAVAPALDFYGSEFAIRDGRVLVPGGPAADKAWEDLVGASPKSPGEFALHLFSRDRACLAAYFDALARIPASQQAHLTESPRLKRLYEVYRSAAEDAGATRGVFPKNGSLLVLLTSLRWQPNGDPYIPGNLSLWSGILSLDSSPALVRGWVRRAKSWDSPEQLLLSLVACTGFDTDIGPAQTYLALSAIDAARAPQPRLSDATVRLVAGQFPRFHSWYPIFAEFPALDDASITKFVQAAESVNSLDSAALRANALGAFQANIGLWQILARQQEIPAAKMNASWQEVVQPFIGNPSSIQLFDATRKSLRSLMMAATGDGDLSEDRIIDVLAGPPQQSEAGHRIHDALADRIRSVLDDQRLVSLDTLFGLYDGLDRMAHGSASADQLIPLAGSLREFEMPRPIFTTNEKIEWAPEIYSSRHAELQVRTDLTRVIRLPGSPAQLEAARAQLTPFLRDTLVGLNYAYYEPPGAQVLHHNPLFVRSHDFTGTSILGFKAIWGTPELIGLGITAGGGAYLIGSLVNLPFALATTEQDFIAPENVQALIWRAAVPSLLVNSVEPRWWNVTSTELHAVALTQRMGEELLQSAASSSELRAKVMLILSDVLEPRRLEQTEEALLHGTGAATALTHLTPADKYYLATEFQRRFPSEAVSASTAARELQDLAQRDPADVNAQRLSRDFGVPHPILAQTNAPALIPVKPIPAFGGGSYGLLGESWESDNLYWARLADELGYPPAALNLLIPELSRRMVARIFATDQEDWPALLRAMRQTGDDLRQRRIRIAAAEPASQDTGSHGMGLN